METKLVFEITKIDGNVETQEIMVDPQDVNAAIQQCLAQYAQVGMLKKEGSKFILLAANQIARVEVSIPSILIARPSEAEKAIGGKISLV
jgi:hypothetical protein